MITPPVESRLISGKAEISAIQVSHERLLEIRKEREELHEELQYKLGLLDAEEYTLYGSMRRMLGVDAGEGWQLDLSYLQEHKLAFLFRPLDLDTRELH